MAFSLYNFRRWDILYHYNCWSVVPLSIKRHGCSLISTHTSPGVNVAFCGEEGRKGGWGGGYLLPTRCWSIRRRSSLLTSPSSDPSICLHCGSSQQSMCCFSFIFIFRYLVTEIQRRFQTQLVGRGSGRVLLMCSSVDWCISPDLP